VIPVERLLPFAKNPEDIPISGLIPELSTVILGNQKIAPIDMRDPLFRDRDNSAL
jgi:hypothetical protein